MPDLPKFLKSSISCETCNANGFVHRLIPRKNETRRIRYCGVHKVDITWYEPNSRCDQYQ